MRSVGSENTHSAVPMDSEAMRCQDQRIVLSSLKVESQVDRVVMKAFITLAFIHMRIEYRIWGSYVTMARH